MEENKEQGNLLTQLSILNNEEISWLRDFILGYEEVLSRELNNQKKMLFLLKTIGDMPDTEGLFKIKSISEDGEQINLNDLNSALFNGESIIKENENRLKLIQSIIKKFQQFDGLIDPLGELSDNPLV